jgi:hypothetical protein
MQRRILATLRAQGSTAGFVDQMTPLPEISRLLGAERYAALEADVVGQRK